MCLLEILSNLVRENIFQTILGDYFKKAFTLFKILSIRQFFICKEVSDSDIKIYVIQGYSV